MKKLILTRTTGRLALVLLMLVSVLTGMKAEAIEDTSTFDSSVWGTGYKTVPDGQYWWNGNVKLTVGEPGSASNDINGDNNLIVMMSAKLTLTGQTGCYLTKFTITGYGDFALTTNTGTMTAVSGGYQWTGRANEVVISCGGDEYDRQDFLIQSISVTYEINLDDLASATNSGAQYVFTSAKALVGTSLHAKTISAGTQEMYLDGFMASTDPEIQQSMTSGATYLHMPSGSRLWLLRSDNNSDVNITKATFSFLSGSPSISPDGGTYDSSTHTWTGKESQLIFSFNEDADIMLVESEAGSLFQVDITSYGRGTTTYDGTTIERGESTNNYMGTATTYMSGDQSMYLTFTPDARRYVYQATRIDGYVNETDITDEANAGSYTLSGLTDDCRIQVYYHLIYPNVTWGSNGNGSISFSGTGLDDQDEETFYDGEPVHEGNKTVGYPYGCTLTFTLLPDDGKELVMLMMNGQDVTDQVTENTFTVTLTQDIDIQAIFEQTAVPVVAPTLFRDGRLFALTTETENATIYYAVDYDMSQTAAPNFMVYSDADTHLLDGAANIWAYAIRDGYLDSETVVYNVTLEDMTARAPSDLTYMDGMVTLTVPDSCVVYYTTDGTIPSATNGTVYDNGIPITSNVTVQAVSVRDFWFDSPVVEYVVNDFQVAPVSFVQNGYRVTLSTTTEGATIHYTISNSGEGEQTCPSGTALSMNGDCSITAYATKDGFSQSEETVYVFTAADVTVATPTFNQTDNLVTITTTTENSTIYYTLDGSEPTTLSNVYAEPGIVVNGNVTVKAFATRPSWFSSPVVTYNVTGFQVAPVTFAQNGNQITLSTTTEDALIHYTLSNGALDEQTCPSGTVLTMTGDCTIMAYATKDGYTQSDPTNFVFYAEGVTCGTPVLDRIEGTNVITATTLTEGATIHYTTDGSEPSEASAIFPEGGLTVSHNQTIKAITLRDTYYPSQVSIFEVNWFQCEMPTFAWNGDALTISSTTVGEDNRNADILYTMVETGAAGTIIPDTMFYNGPITVTSDVTITAIARLDGYNDSQEARLVYPYTAWKSLADAIANAQNVYAQSATSSHVSAEQRSNLQTLTTQAEALYAERTADVDAINNMTSQLTIATSDIEALLEIKDAYAVLTLVSGKNSLVFYYDNQKDARGGMSVGPFSNWEQRGWHPYYEDITNVVFDESFANCTSITSTAYWFYGCSKLATITGLENLNTVNVTDMSSMFYDCSCQGLTSLDVSGFKTDNVTNMSNMFNRCTGLTSLDLSGFNTENVTDMTGMFFGCGALTSLNVTSFKTGNVTKMAFMFHNCVGLTSLDLSSFKTDKVTEMESMFENCNNLQTIYASSDWSTDAVDVQEGSNVFEDCRSLVGGKGTAYDGDHINYTYARIDMAPDAPGYFTDKNAPTEYIIKVSVVGNGTVTIDSVTVASGTEEQITVPAGGNLKMFLNPAAGYLFSTLELDGVNKNESVVAATATAPASYTLWKIYDEHTIVVTFVSKAVEAYAALSENNSKLTFYYDNMKDERGGMSVGPFNVNSDQSWSNARESITTVVFDDSFASCTTLTSTAYWFFNCQNLQEITGLDKLNTANVTGMSYMFAGCSGLISLDVTNFKTDNVINMYQMFYHCSGLTSLDVTNFKTDNVTDMGYMFDGCSGLISLDLSNFKTDKVANMHNMFNGCSSMRTIYAGGEWSTEAIYKANYEYMFDGCVNLVGGMGTSYSANHIDYTYARLDGGPAAPGYFSRHLSKGDANGDGEVNIADAVMTVTNILGQPTETLFHQDMADMNDDSEIDIFDVSMIVTAALNANGSSPAHGMISGIDNIAEEDVRLTKQNNRIYMGIDREGVFTAFQFDVTLPEGVELLGASLAKGGTNHQLTFVKRGDNQYRVVGLSMTNEVFAASDGHLIQLQLSDSSAAGMAKVSNVLFINPVAKDATAIREHRSGEGDEDSIYNLKGQYLGKDRQKLGKGIYVINGKKVYIK